MAFWFHRCLEATLAARASRTRLGVPRLSTPATAVSRIFRTNLQPPHNFSTKLSEGAQACCGPRWKHHKLSRGGRRVVHTLVWLYRWSFMLKHKRQRRSDCLGAEDGPGTLASATGLASTTLLEATWSAAASRNG